MNGGWPLGTFSVEDGEFVLRLPGRRIAFQAEELVELRLSRLPFPTLVFIAKTADGHELGSFSVLRMRRMEEILASTGLQPTSEQRWNFSTSSRQDAERYGLFWD